MNTRRQLLIAIGAAPLLYAQSQGAQVTGKQQRIGYIGGPAKPPGYFRFFRDELQAAGYVEGKNIVFDYKGAEGQLDRIPGLVQELVHSKVDVLVAPNLVSIRAAQQATKTIPIAMVISVDPVAAGIVKRDRRMG